MDSQKAHQDVTPSGDAHEQQKNQHKSSGDKHHNAPREGVAVKLEPDNNEELPHVSDHTERSKADLDLFDTMFESWKNHDLFLKLEVESLKARLNISEKKNVVSAARIEDLETTVDMLQGAMDAIDNGLNLVDSLTKENEKLNFNLKKEQEQKDRLKKEYKEQCEQLQLDIAEVKSQNDKEVQKLKAEFQKKADIKAKEAKAALDNKEKEMEHSKKDKQSQISLLTVEYEEKIAVLQRQKLTAVTNQQQQSSNNQEIFRRKLQHMKQEHEQESSGLKTQIRNLQAQISLLLNKEKTAQVQGRQAQVGQQKRGSFGSTPQRAAVTSHLTHNTSLSVPRQTHSHLASTSSTSNSNYNAFTRAGVLETELPTSNRMTATTNGKVASSGQTLKKIRRF